MSTRALSPEAVTAFLESAAGALDVSVQQRLAATSLLIQLAATAQWPDSADELKWLLAPTCCSNPGQQGAILRAGRRTVAGTRNCRGV